MKPLSSDYKNELLSFATQLAIDAGQLAREMQSQKLEISTKGHRDWVTNADVAVQLMVTDKIQSRFPEHGFLVEEKDGRLPTTGNIIWIIDPIDGTTNYSRGMPNYCVAIAVMVNNQIEVGVVYSPINDSLFTAIRGKGSLLNGKSIAVSEGKAIDRAIVCLDWAHKPKARQETITKLSMLLHKIGTIRTIGSSALSMCWIACGRLDIYYNLTHKAWDVAAAALILAEAGGRTSSWNNEEWDMQKSETWRLNSNGFLHNEVCEIIGAASS